jgi:hypothetical protein
MKKPVDPYPVIKRKYLYSTATAAVRATMRKGGWWTGPAMQKEVKRLTGKLFSESGITARIRECREYFPIESRPKRGSASFEYRVEVATQKAA